MAGGAGGNPTRARQLERAQALLERERAKGALHNKVRAASAPHPPPRSPRAPGSGFSPAPPWPRPAPPRPAPHRPEALPTLDMHTLAGSILGGAQRRRFRPEPQRARAPQPGAPGKHAPRRGWGRAQPAHAPYVSGRWTRGIPPPAAAATEGNGRLTGPHASGQVPMKKTEPAKFRNLALNSHDTVGKTGQTPKKAAADGQRTVPSSRRGTLQGSQPGSRASGSQPSQSRRSSKPASEVSGVDESRFRSVFEGQKPSERAIEKRLAKAASPWAALAEIETQMHAKNEQMRRARKAAAIQQQREFLDSQIEEHAVRKAGHKQDLLNEAQQIANEVARYNEDEKRKLRKQREYMSRIKQDREDQVVLAQRKKQMQLEKKQYEEARELRRVNEALQQESRKAAERRENHRQEMQQVIIENEARSLLKDEKHRKNQEEDERLRLEYLEMQKVQEARREKAFKDMYAKSQGRAALAGAQVAKEAKEKVDRDAALLSKQQREWEEEKQRQEAADREKHKSMIADLRQVRAQQMAEKNQRRMQEKAEIEAYSEQTRLKDEREKALEQEKQRKKRMANLKHQDELKEQMKEMVQRRIYEGSMMSVSEQAINHPVLATFTRD